LLDRESLIKQKKVLLVDDVSVFLQLEETFFRRRNCIILTAKSGEEALKIIHTEKPDLVILDLIMPGIQGDKVCRMIKSSPNMNDIPVIIVSKSGKERDIENCMRAGCDAYITKPITQTDLLNKAAELLRIPARKSTRIFVKVEVEGQKGKDIFYGTTENISESGIYIICEKALEPNTDLLLKFYLPGSRDEISVTGKIARIEKAGNKKGYGLTFSNVSPDAKEKIDKFIIDKT